MFKTTLGRLKLHVPIPFVRGQRPPTNTTLQDYDEYLMSPGQITLAALWGATIMAAIAYVFYKHPGAAFFFGAIGLGYPSIRRKQLIRKRKAQLKLQFKQMLAALASAISAGRSVESAFVEALSDLRLLYPDSKAMIIKELEMMQRRMENGETIESCLIGFSRRAHIDEIERFAEVFVTCKRTGGSLVQVVRRTAVLIQEKLDIEQDIQVLLAQKKFESKVLSVTPVAIIATLAWSTPDYMEPLYQGGGLLIMSCALAVLLGCYALAQKIMDIKV
ncbi:MULTISPECIES: type II secretion system F family protein [unclassified Paenibacillus]|uniref:type II secretion system F family protein n=1 Tax=unclassified Paenibacillus TaxID=185978 RepID=UPI001AE5EBA0|nr:MULTISPECIES: type II secretion system F family protein [unclassified Paenibacillus]MBP1155488.1 tight adherence protein B [Paenibacillus sp. PvP091]MBP1169126.1 tight adherence protein B [Paenibacillus sp. PvR098]MBP2440154.1 tight adherence protein B [Paenibacillus sp. PvP052]